MDWRCFIIFALAAVVLVTGCSPPTPAPTPTPLPTATRDVAPTKEPTPEALATAMRPTEEPTPAFQFPPATIVNDEGGPVRITGIVTYTNPFFTVGVAEPLVILEDQAGFVDRDEGFLMPVQSQTLGQITSDFFTSPFSYTLALPIQPQGTWRDVDHDTESDTGVQVFAIAYWTNIFGDPFLEERDLGGGGWSTGYASTLVSDESDTRREILGGKLLVYAPDDRQGFPSGFGEDGLLFTPDDPLVSLPPGYTLVDLDTDPFTFDRSQRPVVNLIEPESAALADYSEMSYTEAFDALVDQMRKEYAFTEHKGIDWDELHAAFRPTFELADEEAAGDLYRRALRDFARSIPDGHIGGSFLQDEISIQQVSGGLGIAVSELDDGRVLVTFLLVGGPADAAGIRLGAEILAFDGIAMRQVISDTVAISAPFSTLHNERLDQLRFVTRFPVGTQVAVTYRNPGSSSAPTAILTAVPEVDSIRFATTDVSRTGFELPLEYERLESGLGYVQIYSFFDNELLTIQLWERMMRTLIDNQVTALIVDMRLNSGGNGFLADQMAAYFFQEPLVLGNRGFYDEDQEAFTFDPQTEDRFFLPEEELRYDGDLVVLVGPNCASACEFFAYNLTLEDRAVVVGQYPTAGLGGSVERVAMPEGIEFQFTRGRAVDPDGNIHIEGTGVVPSIRVPVDETTVFGEGDPVLEAALRYLLGEEVDGGAIRVGQAISGQIQRGMRVRYALSLSKGDFISIILQSDTPGQDLILSLLDESGELLAATEPDTLNGFLEIEAPFNLTFLLEVSTEDNAGSGAYTLTVVDERS